MAVDRYVKALIFRIDPLLDHAFVRHEETFSVTVKDGEAEFEFKHGVETVDEARQALSEYIRNWEFSAALERGLLAIELRYKRPRFEERNPVPGKVSLSGGISTGPPELSGDPTVARCPYRYPEPPAAIQITPDVQMAFDRFIRYLKDEEPLPGMAYFCQSKLRQSVPDRAWTKPRKDENAEASESDTGRWYEISSSVLRKIRALSSSKGGPEARKADGIGKALSNEEAKFLEKATATIIRRMAEKAHDPDGNLPEITMSDLPDLLKDRQPE